MANNLGEVDPRLVDPDKYFVENYGDTVIEYGERRLPLRAAVKFENMARKPEDIAKDPKARRANVFTGMLREAGVLSPEDDITYTEGS